MTGVIPAPPRPQVPGVDYARTLLDIWVPGLPGAQGSKAYKGHRRDKKTGRDVPVLVEQSKTVAPWRTAVQTITALTLNRAAGGHPWTPHTGPVAVSVLFTLPKGRTVTRHLPTVPPDLDKLERAVFDALTHARLWNDDSQVVSVTADKVYAQPHPGAYITVHEVTP